jgi:hypothetical protein
MLKLPTLLASERMVSSMPLKCPSVDVDVDVDVASTMGISCG